MPSLGKIVKPREPEIPGSGASDWKRDPVGKDKQNFNRIIEKSVDFL